MKAKGLYSMAGIGIIANPHSKLNKRYPERQHLLSYIAGESGHFKLTNNLEELTQVADDFYHREISILAINGGDGTISHTISAMIKRYQGGPRPLPKMVLLRGGTINVLADNLQMVGRPEQILYRLIEAHSLGQVLPEVRFSTLQIGEKYGFIFASGASARFLKEFYKNKTGALGSVLLTAKVMLSSLTQGALFKRIVAYEYVSCTCEDEGTVRHGTVSMLAATVPHAPFKRRLFPRAELENEKIHLVSAAMEPETLVPRFLPFFVIYPEASQRGKLRLSAKKFTFTSDRTIPYTLDGELYQSRDNNLALNVGPKITFLIV
jgi:diacylglycerol kinase family enzyme